MGAYIVAGAVLVAAAYALDKAFGWAMDRL